SKSNLNTYSNSNSIKAKGGYDNFVIDTEYINSIEGENFHSLTYLVTYPEHPNLYVNLIFFSNDFTYYHPVIYKYNLSPGEITRDVIIRKDQMVPIRIGEGQNYLDALAGIPTTTNFETNDPCVVVYEKQVEHKCESGMHGVGEGCDYAGGEGEAYYSYELVIDVSDCGGSGGGGGDTGGGNPGGGNPGGGGGSGGGGNPGGGGYVGIDDPNNPNNPTPVYDHPWLGGPDGGGWQPADPVITLPNLPLPGRINVRFFKNGLNSEQLVWWNNTTEKDQRAGLYDYVYKGGDFEFAEWVIDLFIENPDTTWDQFENWFMVTTNGKDGDYDANYWENPNLVIQQQNLPSYDDFYNEFPLKNGGMMLSPEVYQLVGGQLYNNHLANPSGYSNACAIRVSRALNYSGVIVPNISGQTEKGADNKNYFLSAKNLNAWMEKTFGKPTGSNRLTGAQGGINGENFPNLLQNKQGVYIMIANYPGPSYFGATGHADIMENGTCPDDRCYFNAKGGVHFINIWELN